MSDIYQQADEAMKRHMSPKEWVEYIVRDEESLVKRRDAIVSACGEYAYRAMMERCLSRGER